MSSKTQLIHTIRYNANQILVESWSQGANLNNYDYLLNLSKRLDTISDSIVRHDAKRQGWFTNEPVCNTVAQSIHEAILALIPSVPVIDFDWVSEGEDLDRLCLKAYNILRACDEDGSAMGVCHKHNLFTTMCELQEKLDEQWLTDLAND